MSAVAEHIQPPLMRQDHPKEVFILSAAPLHGTGGVERLLRYLVAGLEERGFAVRVFDSGNAGPEFWCRPRPGRKIVRALGDGLHGYFVGRAAQRALHPSVCLVFSTSTVGWYPIKADVPKAHFYHGTYWGVAEAIRPWIRPRGYLKLKWWDALTLEKLSGRSKVLLCNSDQTRQEIKARFGYESRTVWLPLDTELFRPLDRMQCRKRTGLPQSARVGLFVGSLEPHKGYPLVRGLMDSLPTVEWVLAIRGKLPDVCSLPRQARVVHGLSDEQLVDFYNAADFLICPSRYEPFGYVVAESLACGTPAISTMTGASQLLMQRPPLNSLLVQSPSDVEAFKAAVEAVMRDPESFRQNIVNTVRPQIEEVMAPENWWPRFFEVTGL